MNDFFEQRLADVLASIGFQGSFAICKAGDRRAHFNIAPSTFHTVGNKVVRLDWPQGLPPTKQQHAAMEATIKSFDFRPRKPREAEAIIRDITERPAEHVRLINDTIDNAMRAEFLQRNPKFLTDLGMNIPGDEVEN